MSTKNFTTVFVVNQTPDQVFSAINRVREWWSGEVEGSTEKLGDEFTYRHEDLHFSRQKITELVPGKKVVWTVMDGLLSFVTNKTEWKSTQIVFEISTKGSQTEVRFTHVGLIPELECFDDCSSGWNYFAGQALKEYIETGKVS